jgi:ribosomal protein S18 acetylase RimI-like enzyme
MAVLGVEEKDLAADLIGAALGGPDRHFAVGGDGPVLRYRPDVAPFATLGPAPDAAAWEALTALPGDLVALIADRAIAARAPWRAVRELPVLLMGGSGVETSGEDPEIVELGDQDVAEMLDLVARTAPGPFLARTIEFGGYVGIRRDGVLAAMAGRRVQPPGWIEVSAVCTDPAYRGLGLARRVMSAVVARIRDDDAQAFLHVLPSNPACRLYESMGFVVLRESVITAVERVS